MRALVAVLIVASGIAFVAWFNKKQSKARETRANEREVTKTTSKQTTGPRRAPTAADLRAQALAESRAPLVDRSIELAQRQADELFEW